MKHTAVIILNRNLPEVTDELYECVRRNNEPWCDIYVVEAGSEKDKLSKYCTWHAQTEEVMRNGLRMPRGINYAIAQLLKEGKWSQYEYFLFLPNDVEFEEEPIIDILYKEMEAHSRLGILSPASERWGEAALIGADSTRYFWAVEQLAWYMRRGFIEDIMNVDDDSDDYMNTLYDGSNFRGYCSNVEMVAKGYANDWASGITTKVWMKENEKHLKTMPDLIKTDSYEENMGKYVAEGNQWLRRKYGFSGKWSMYMYAKCFYDKFFEYFPELMQYGI